MRSNGPRSKKTSKDAQAERILQSLFYKSKSSLAPSSRKIRKRRRSAPERSFSLAFRAPNGQRRTLSWLLPAAPENARAKPAKASSRRKREAPRAEAPKAKAEAQVNYADLFESAYKVVKSESAGSRSGRQVPGGSEPKTAQSSQTRAHDSFSGIEYDPADNYFYLVSHLSAQKRPLFQNRALFSPAQKPCLVINPRLVESLKKDFALEGFLS